MCLSVSLASCHTLLTVATVNHSEYLWCIKEIFVQLDRCSDSFERVLIYGDMEAGCGEDNVSR